MENTQKLLPHFIGSLHAEGSNHKEKKNMCERQAMGKITEMTAEVRGENIGGKITIHHNAMTNHDVVSFYITGGMNNNTADCLELAFSDPFKPSGLYQ